MQRRRPLYVCMYVFMYSACAMKFYACVCVSATLAHYNPICSCISGRHTCAMLVQQRGQNEPLGDDCELSGGRFTEQVPIVHFVAVWLLDPSHCRTGVLC